MSCFVDSSELINRLFMGISDEIEVVTVAIDETTILEIKATTVLPF